MANLHLDAQTIEREIDALILAYPELADDAELRADMIEGSTEAHSVLSRIARAVIETEALSGGIADARKALADRAARMDRRAEALRGLAHRLMERADLQKVELPEATLSIRAAQPSVVIVDEAALPPAYVRTKTEPDKTAIRAALKAGVPVAGAALSNGGATLSVRVA